MSSFLSTHVYCSVIQRAAVCCICSNSQNPSNTPRLCCPSFQLWWECTKFVFIHANVYVYVPYVYIYTHTDTVRHYNIVFPVYIFTAIHYHKANPFMCIQICTHGVHSDMYIVTLFEIQSIVFHKPFLTVINFEKRICFDKQNKSDKFADIIDGKTKKFYCHLLWRKNFICPSSSTFLPIYRHIDG